MPASASPDITLLRTSVTFCSSETGLSFTPSFLTSSAVAVPHGTVLPPADALGVQMTSLALSRDELRPVTFAGFPLGVMRTRVFEAKIFVSATLPPDLSASIVVVLAVATTSAGAPELICSTSS